MKRTSLFLLLALILVNIGAKGCDNEPPELNTIGNKATFEEKALAFTVTAHDPDGDPVTFTVQNLPAGAAFNPVSGDFYWKPAFDQAGVYTNVRFTASDGEDTDSETIQITVDDVPYFVWAIGNNANYYYTPNEGAWEDRTPGDLVGERLDDMVFLDPYEAWVTGGGIYHYLDWAWTERPELSDHKFTEIAMLDASYGMVIDRLPVNVMGVFDGTNWTQRTILNPEPDRTYVLYGVDCDDADGCVGYGQAYNADSSASIPVAVSCPQVGDCTVAVHDVPTVDCNFEGWRVVEANGGDRVMIGHCAHADYVCEDAVVVGPFGITRIPWWCYPDDASLVSATSLWVIENAELRHFDGTDWIDITMPSVSSSDWYLSAVEFISDNEGWITGVDNENQKGLLFHYLNGNVTLENIPDHGGEWDLNGIVAADADL